MRLAGIRFADVILAARERASTLVWWPSSAGLRRPVDTPPAAAVRIDPAEAAAWEAVVREAFRAGSPVVTTRSTPPAQSSGAPAPRIARLGTSSSASRRRSRTAPAAVFNAAREPETGGPPKPENRRQDGATAPDHLLRTPTSVALVADDFFEGLVRRVEGDA